MAAMTSSNNLEAHRRPNNNFQCLAPRRLLQASQELVALRRRAGRSLTLPRRKDHRLDDMG